MKIMPAPTFPSIFQEVQGKRSDTPKHGFLTNKDLAEISRSQLNFIDDLKALVRILNIRSNVQEETTNTTTPSWLSSGLVGFILDTMHSASSSVVDPISGAVADTVDPSSFIDLLVDYDPELAEGLSESERITLSRIDSIGGLMLLKAIYDCLGNASYSTKKVSGISREKLYFEIELKNTVSDYQTFLNELKQIQRYSQEPLLWNMMKCFSGTAFGVCFGSYGDEIEVIGIPSRTKYMGGFFVEHLLPALGTFVFHSIEKLQGSGDSITNSPYAQMWKKAAILLSSFVPDEALAAADNESIIRQIFEMYKDCTIGVCIDKNANNFNDLIKVNVYSGQSVDPVVVIPIDLNNITNPFINSNILSGVFPVLEEAVTSGTDISMLSDKKITPSDIVYSDQVFKDAKAYDIIFSTSFFNFAQSETLYRALRLNSDMTPQQKQSVISYYTNNGCNTSMKSKRADLKNLPAGYIPLAESQHLEDVSLKYYGLNKDVINNTGWLVNLFAGLIPKPREPEKM